MFITGANDTGDKLFTGVTGTADKFFTVLLTLAIRQCCQYSLPTPEN
jgi:hypothetical protein